MHELSITLNDEIGAALEAQARLRGQTKSQVVQELLEKWLNGDTLSVKKTPGALRKHFGSVDSGNPRSADNEAIDADLAKEYGRGL